MEETTKEKFRKIRRVSVLIKFLMDRGLGLLTTPYTIIKYSTFAGLFVELLNKAFGLGISLKATMILTPFLALFGIIVGYLDVKVLHILQVENEIATGFNPVIDKISQRVANVFRKMNHIK